MFAKLFASATVAHAHCDLYCGVYDPAQAKIEALSVVKTAKKYAESDDEVFRARCISIKEAARRGDQAPPDGAVGRLLRSRPLRGVPAAPRAVLEGDPPGRRGQEVDGPRRRRAAGRATSTRSPRSSGRPRRPRAWASTRRPESIDLLDRARCVRVGRSGLARFRRR